MNQSAKAAFKSWSILLYGTAKMGFRCRDSQAVQRLFAAGAEELPQMLCQKQHCTPQSVSNPLWAFATAEYGGSLQQLIAEVANNLERVMKGANPQEWANNVWALATLHERKVVLGEQSAVSKIVSAGVDGMVQQRGKAVPQSQSNTLWALATLGHHHGDTNIHTLSTAMAERSNTVKPVDLSQTLWALATLDYSPAILSTLATAMAERISTAKPQELSSTLLALAKLGHHPGTSTIKTLATAMAESSSAADPQALSNTLWALAKLGHNPGNAILSTLAIAMAERISTAKPQELSSTLWALAKLGHHLGTSTINTLATAMAESSNAADPQALSNTLWALAKLGHNPGNIIMNTLVTAMAERINTADPQEISNTLWALADLGHNPGNGIIYTLATAMAERSSTAAPQALSNALQALGSLHWYRAEVYSKLVERLLHSIRISGPDEFGQQFSNALFSCALSCHFDSSIDALAAWGSQQDLKQWTEQEASNTLYAWVILTATAGDTANMRMLAQHLFMQANRRGAARFTVENDLGKLYGAHLEAQYKNLPGGGLADASLLQVADQRFADWHQSFAERNRSFTSIIATTLQGSFEVQAAKVQGYHTLLVLHPSCPRGIAVVVTHHERDYLSHPAQQLYGKTALKLKHIGRSCDGLVLCDESELKGSSDELVRGMLLKRIKQVEMEE